MNSVSLLRYNFRVLMYNNWWLLVFPIAASQLTVFWNIITQRFQPALPARSVEMITPLLAAFLSAHLLSAEYRTGMGAILASKPMHIGTVVLRRLAVVMALVWFLAALSLVAYYYGMEPYDMGRPFLAGVASSLFLAMLALTFATLLRHPLAGFAVSAIYWAADLPAGPQLNPYLSISSLSQALQPADQLTLATLPGSWWVSKVVLCIGAAVLYRLHGRLLFGLGTPMTQRHRRRTFAWAGAMIVVYVMSGAVLKVGYGYANRANLAPDDASWFRRQFASFGPIPVNYLFGSAFRRYLGDVPTMWRLQAGDEADLLGATLQHRRDLQEILDRMPNSIWAPSAAELLARLDVQNARVHYSRIVEKYPASPYLASAFERLAHLDADAGNDDGARAQFVQLLDRCPGSRYETDALRYMAESDRRRHDLPSAEKWARRWVANAATQEKFTAHVFLAQVLLDLGRRDDAHAEANLALAASKELQRALLSGELQERSGRTTRWQQAAAVAEEQARAVLAR